MSRRRLTAILIAVAALMVLVAARPLLRWTTIDVDLNSGRIRSASGTGPVTWNEEVKDTRVSELIGGNAADSRPADWHRMHVHRGWSGARINYRYGGAEGTLNSVGWAMDEFNVPEAERPEIARRALDLFRERGSLTVTTVGEGKFQFRDADGVLYEWKKPP